MCVNCMRATTELCSTESITLTTDSQLVLTQHIQAEGGTTILHTNMQHNENLVYIYLSPFQWPFSSWTCVSQHRNDSITDFIGAKDDGGGAW